MLDDLIDAAAVPMLLYVLRQFCKEGSPKAAAKRDNDAIVRLVLILERLANHATSARDQIKGDAAMKVLWRIRRDREHPACAAAGKLLQHMGQETAAMQIQMVVSGFVMRRRTQRMSRLVKEAMSRRASQSGAVASSEKPLLSST